MKQPIEEIEKHYEQPDPWGYQTHKDDIYRKWRIIKAAQFFRKQQFPAEYSDALDIGAGEGWITRDLPAHQVYGYEISDHAKKRWPSPPWMYSFDPFSTLQFDLITATGVLYAHYDYELFHQMIHRHASDIVITCHIKDWEIPVTGLNQIYEEEFPYREYIQKLRVFRV